MDAVGNAYVTGWTRSTDFPTHNALQPDLAGSDDAFVAVLAPNGRSLLYSTYLGGSAGDAGLAIAVDTEGNAYVAGRTWSSDFPTTVNAFSENRAGNGQDTFISKIGLGGHLLAASRSGAGSGWVYSSAPDARIDCGDQCAAIYGAGTPVTLVASPTVDSTFVGWEGDCSGTGPCTVTMDANKSVTATFTVSTYDLATAVSPAGAGTVSCSPNPVPHGDTSVCTATANAGYSFTAWSGDCLGASCELTGVTAAKSVTANFTLNSHALTVTKSGNGGVASMDEGIDCGSICNKNYGHGTNVTLTATPDTGYGFVGWDGACTGTGTCMVTMDAAKSVTANFALNTYPVTVTISPADAGTAACTPNPVEHGGGSVCTVTGTNVGYSFANWSDDCTGASCTLSNVTAAKGVTVNFTRNSYLISVTTSPATGGTASCAPNPVEHGGTATCTANANAGYGFTGWSGDCSGARCELTGVTGPKSLTANFVPLTLAIDDVSHAEGNSGTTAFVFTVGLNAPSPVTVTVNYATANGTATTKGKDYTAASGTLTFDPSQTSQTLIVNVRGDTAQEANETFYVNLAVPTGGPTLADAQGEGIIVNDDLPTLKINDVSKREGRSGTTAFTFTVSLSAASAGVVAVGYATADATATVGSDYTAASGTVSFNPSEKSKTVTVNVTGDTSRETNETFFVHLTNPVGATITDDQGLGTILNDD